MKVAFRADASTLIGTGHVMRCLTLAAALRNEGVTCTFFCRSQPNDMREVIASQGHEVRLLTPLQNVSMDVGLDSKADADDAFHAHWLGTSSAQDAQDTLAAMDGQFWDWLVVDHYALDVKWETYLRRSCRQLAVLDDLADRDHDCDLLLDPGVEPDLPSRYKQRVPRTTKLLIGPQFAILRQEFEVARARVSSINPLNPTMAPSRVLVMFGGNDAAGHTLEALEAIALTAPLGTVVDVVVSSINQDLVRLDAFCVNRANFILHFASNEVANLMAQADLVVASGGGAVYERLYLRRPSLIKLVAENQRKPLQYMASVGMFGLYNNRDELEAALCQAFQQGLNPPPDVVRNGVPTLTRNLLQRLVSLQGPRSLDMRRSYYWLKDAGLRQKFLLRGDAPTRHAHFQYWRRLLADKRQRIFSIYQGCQHVGTAGLRNINHFTGQAELWLYLGIEAKRGEGLGKVALYLLECIIRDQLKCHTAVLHVSRFNLPAYELYCHSGYHLSCYQNAEGAGFMPGLSVVRMEKKL